MKLERIWKTMIFLKMQKESYCDFECQVWVKLTGYARGHDCFLL